MFVGTRIQVQIQELNAGAKRGLLNLAFNEVGQVRGGNAGHGGCLSHADADPLKVF
jgi:hypothetical protein